MRIGNPLVDLDADERATIGDAVVPWIHGSYESDYEAIRSGAGLLDLSGCGLVQVGGPGAAATLQSLFTRDVSYLSYETSTMGLLLDAGGHVLDIATVYKVVGGFLVETSFGNGTSTREHLTANAEADTIVEASEELALGVEGPTAWTMLDEVLEEPASGLPFQGVRRANAAGRPVLLSRTGCTGEFGAKLIADRSDAAVLWSSLVAAGARPVGVQALETAMIEVRQPVLHREVHDAPSVGAAGYNWLVDLEKESFLGREAAFESILAPGHRTVCFRCPAPPDGLVGVEVATSDRAVGTVVAACWSPSLGETVGIARLIDEVAAAGLALVLRTPSPTTAVTVSSPIVVPSSWHLITLAE